MARKKTKKIKSSSFLIILAATTLLFLTLYLLNQKNMILNLNSTASRNRYTTTGTLVKSMYASCNQTYTYGLINPSDNKCTSLIIGASLADPHLGQKVQLKGALKNGLFYVTSVKSLSGSEEEKPSTPGATGTPYSEYPDVSYPDIIKSKPTPSTDKIVPPPRYIY